jgi:Matrixin
MRESVLLACALVVGCAPASPGPAPVAVATETCHTGPVTLWLDFEGAGVVHAASDNSAAMPVQSVLAPTSAVIPPFSWTAIAPKVTRTQAIAAIVDRVRTIMRPYAVDVVTARPAAPPYTRVLIGGTAAALGASTTEAGLARLDCGNFTDADVTYDFAAEQTPDYGGVVGIANTAAHEAGHAFGLEHVDDPHDVMYAVAQPMLTLPDLFTLAFGAGGSYSSYGGAMRQCGTVDPVDEPTLLGCAVGARAAGGDTTPPTLSWPPPPSDVATSFALAADASDDVGVVRVEIYKNLELVASLAAPPYQASVAAAPGERFYVTVEAVDAAANRATLTRVLTAAPPGGGGAGGTGGGQGGGGGAGGGGGGEADHPTSTGGCAVAPVTPAPAPWLFMLAAVALAVRAAARRR